MDTEGRIIKVELKHEQIKDRTWPEIRINNAITVCDLKQRLYTHTGTRPAEMILYAYDPANVDSTQVLLDRDELQINKYGVDDRYVIYIRVAGKTGAQEETSAGAQYPTHISNLTHSRLSAAHANMHKHYVQQLEKCQEAGDEEAFEHYKMSDEDYEKRGRGLREFIANMRAKSTTATAQTQQRTDEAKPEPAPTLEELKQRFPVGARCLIAHKDIRGTVKFAGKVKNNNLIGVDLDEPLGDSDGSLGGVRYFDAQGPKYGAFFKHQEVQVGDYPEVDPFDIE